jgi:predicted HicB family RNase H-like nuclease
MIMNTMELDGYTAVIRYNPETDEFRGEIQGLNGGAEFFGHSSEELRREFRLSLEFFLETCAKHGIEPKKKASGKFVVRLPPELHRQAATAANASGISMNALIERAIKHELAHG